MISFLEPFGNIYSAFLRKGRISLVSGDPSEHTGTPGARMGIKSGKDITAPAQREDRAHAE